MGELFRVRTPQDALADLLSRLTPLAETETLPLERAVGRVCATDIIAPEDLPPFDRSAMDGYAVRAADTYGAAEGLPCELKIAGEIPMGKPAGIALSAGQAAIIHTGGMLPPGADAVIMLEHGERIAPDTVAVLRPAAPGQHVIASGEDVKKGEPLLRTGRLLGAAELGLLAAEGILRVVVRRRPRVAILSQGDEIVPCATRPGPGQVRDVHRTVLSVLSRKAGAEPLCLWPVLPDERSAIEEAARQAHSAADLVLLTAGSSVSVRDVTADCIAALGQPGILCHGLALRPGKPTVVALCGGKPVFGLPGNPVSAALVFRRMVAPVLWHLQGARPPPAGRLQASLTRSVPSDAGREDWVPVTLEATPTGYQATPLFGKSNSIGLLARADALLAIPEELTGIQAGVSVVVELW